MSHLRLLEELPPPLPTEAKMAWLTNIAIPKGELNIKPIVTTVTAPQPVRNVWEGLPNLPRQRTPNHNARFISAKFPSRCHGCEDDIERGDQILWFKMSKRVFCSNCQEYKDHE